MSQEVVQRYQRWYDHEKDAHARVVRSLESVPTERRGTPEFQRAISLLGHLIAARRMWLGRLGVLPPFQGPFFPEGADLAPLVDELRTVERHWTEYLGRLNDDDLARTFEYQSLDAGRFRNRIEDILAQLFGHSWYHRGQIAMLVRKAGGEPAITDLIYWCREPLPSAGH